MKKGQDKKSTSIENIIWNTRCVVSETIQCMVVACQLVEFCNNEEQRMFFRLSLERVITNLSQLIVTYQTHTVLTLGKEEKKSYERVHRIRNDIVHVYTDIKAIIKATNNRIGFAVVGAGVPCAVREGNIVLGNNFTDDVKIFYGHSFVLIRRDLLRLVCRITEHYNSYAHDNCKLSHNFLINGLYELTDAEPSPA